MRFALPALAAITLYAGSATAADPVPHHEHVALYENCVTNVMAQMKPEQAIFAKSICMCQSTMFAKKHTY
ncbi:MAG: hypothetical protein O2944_05905 [Proteobacteria bacterium]|nr:hypothetical protein [Pseudomonadota bacterium]